MRRTGNSGVTLIELLVVVSIIGILAVALGFSFQGWIGNYKIESQIKNLYADLMEARTKALTRNFTYISTITSGDYLIVEDSDSSGTINEGDSCLLGTPPCQPKKLESGYRYKLFSAGALPVTLTIDTRGLTSVGAATMYFGIDHSTDLTPDYDCIIVTQDRIRMGKWNGVTSCDEK